MIVTCDRAELQAAMSLIVNVSSPLHQCVHMVAGEDELHLGEDELHLTATDGQIRLRVPVHKVETHEPGAVLVPAAKLAQIIRASQDETLLIEAGANHRVDIITADAKFQLYGVDPAQAMDWVNITDAVGVVFAAGDELAHMINASVIATSKDSTRYALKGVLAVLRKGEHPQFVAMDGRRLAIATAASTVVEDSGGGIIPTKALALLRMILAGNRDTQVCMDIGSRAVQFQVEGIELRSSLLEGIFPPYREVVPTAHTITATFDVAPLLSAVSRAGLLTSHDSHGVRMNFEYGSLVITSRTPEVGEASISLEPAAYEGEPIEIGFNPTYLADALRVVGAEQITLHMSDPARPAVIKDQSGRFCYVLMPIKLEDEQP